MAHTVKEGGYEVQLTYNQGTISVSTVKKNGDLQDIAPNCDVTFPAGKTHADIWLSKDLLQLGDITSNNQGIDTIPFEIPG